MSGRTAEEVIAEVLVEFAREGTRTTVKSGRILAALADAGLVVCADGEANCQGNVVQLGSRQVDRTGYLSAVKYEVEVLGEPDPRCIADVGKRPSWMGVDQYDPCRCVLLARHDGEHVCRHTVEET